MPTPIPEGFSLEAEEMESVYHNIIGLEGGPHFRLLAIRPSLSAKASIVGEFSIAELFEDVGITREPQPSSISSK
jgi:hypothetical protein